MIAVGEIAVKLGSRDQDAAQAGELTDHLASDQTSNGFLTYAEFCRAAFYVEGLAFDGCCCIHNCTFTRQQATTHRDLFGAADTQNAASVLCGRRGKAQARTVAFRRWRAGSVTASGEMFWSFSSAENDSAWLGAWFLVEFFHSFHTGVGLTPGNALPSQRARRLSLPTPWLACGNR